jgi:hypothetical protein
MTEGCTKFFFHNNPPFSRRSIPKNNIARAKAFGDS